MMSHFKLQKQSLNIIFLLTRTLAFFLVIFFSCDESPAVFKSTTDDSIQNGGRTLKGTITQNLNIPLGSYYLSGVLEVNSGITLTIAAGSTFTVRMADVNNTNILVIKQGGKIIAEGTETSPIVFTSENKQSGSWGGIIILGKAPINVAGGSAKSEAGLYDYGGTESGDNSGSLKYVRVEYAGSKISNGTSEYNAFSFFALGSGTKMSYLEAYQGADDGFEFYGGTVSANNLLAIDCEDDSFDWDQGWTGSGSEWIAQQHANSDNAIEASNHPSEFARIPVAKPTLSKITLRRKAARADGKTSVGITFKDGTGGQLSDLHISGVDQGILIGDTLISRYAIDDPTRLTLSRVNITAAKAIVAYKVSTSSKISSFPPANDVTVIGAPTDWAKKGWVLGYVD